MGELDWLDEIRRRADAAMDVASTEVASEEKLDLVKQVLLFDVLTLYRAVRELRGALSHATSLLLASDVPNELWEADVEVLERWQRGGA